MGLNSSVWSTHSATLLILTAFCWSINLLSTSTFSPKPIMEVLKTQVIESTQYNRKITYLPIMEIMSSSTFSTSLTTLTPELALTDTEILEGFCRVGGLFRGTLKLDSLLTILTLKLFQHCKNQILKLFKVENLPRIRIFFRCVLDNFVSRSQTFYIGKFLPHLV